MNDNEKDVFNTASVAIALLIAFIAVIVWFIFWIQSGIKTEQMKHETCMVETYYRGTGSDKSISSIVEYCGPKGKLP